MKVVRLSALRTGRLYLSGNIPGTHFSSRLSKPQGLSAARRIMAMKNSSDTIGNERIQVVGNNSSRVASHIVEYKVLQFCELFCCNFIHRTPSVQLYRHLLRYFTSTSDTDILNCVDSYLTMH